jgi:hypothetical protein
LFVIDFNQFVHEEVFASFFWAVGVSRIREVRRKVLQNYLVVVGRQGDQMLFWKSRP